LAAGTPMMLRIVVADRSAAFFYDTPARHAPLQLAGQLSDPKARLHDRDFESDRPGRTFDRAPPATGRRGAVAHHDMAGERSPSKHEAELFARQIGAELEGAHRQHRFDRLVLMAGPAFLGLLRETLPPSLHKQIVAEVDKDLVHQTADAVITHVPPQAFDTLS
jgi:protein required for attachment to host cells